MIVVYHNSSQVVSVVGATIKSDGLSLPECLKILAQQFPDEILVWCHQRLEKNLNQSAIEKLFSHKKMMFSYRVADSPYLSTRIGYVEDSPIINVNKSDRFPTWLMSSNIGATHASLLNACRNQLSFQDNPDYFFNSLAKMAMPLGLFCYSEPQLLSGDYDRKMPSATISELFKFVSQHYKTRWIFLLLLNIIIYEKKFPLLAFFQSFFYKKRKLEGDPLQALDVLPKARIQPTIDVLIPTIGRKTYLHDVLKDLNNQTLPPTNVIIIEQNPQSGSVSELDYLTTEKWNFEISHTFIHQSGVCNARNIGLGQIKSEWVFFADDDIRIPADFLEKTFADINRFGAGAATVNCYREGDVQLINQIVQWPFFGAGCSVVLAKNLAGLTFPIGYEFGFGEDNDFGMQLRNKGVDIIYLPNPGLLHLKAPIGGFRTKASFPWDVEKIQPKPSPTISLFLLKHYTKQQLNGYRTILFFKFYRHQPLKNPFSYFKNFNFRFERSLFYATELMKKS